MRWTNPSQPVTLQQGVILAYIHAVFAVISPGIYRVALEPLLGGVAALAPLLIAIGLGAGGWGVANERKWGYKLAVTTAIVSALCTLRVAFWADFHWSLLIGLMFDIALVVLLVHEDSRNYSRIWFK